MLQDDGELLIDDVNFDNLTWESDYGLANSLADGLTYGFTDVLTDGSTDQSHEDANDAVSPLGENPYNVLYRSVVDEAEKPVDDVTTGKGSNRDHNGRVFQAFWCGDQEEEEQLPKPDSYGLHQQQLRRTKQSSGQKRRKSRMFEDLANYSQSFFDDSTPSVHYAPKRPPPILDFIFVLTSFIVAVVMAYYSAV